MEDRHEVLDVDEGVLAAVHLERLEGFHYQLPEVFPPLLTIVDAVSQVVWNNRDSVCYSMTIGREQLSTHHVMIVFGVTE